MDWFIIANLVARTLIGLTLQSQIDDLAFCRVPVSHGQPRRAQ
jgi:hypothetical protein